MKRRRPIPSRRQVDALVNHLQAEFMQKVAESICCINDIQANLCKFATYYYYYYNYLLLLLNTTTYYYYY